MDIRNLKSRFRALRELFRAMREEGVAFYAEGDLRVQLAGAMPQVPEGDVEGQEELALPTGVLDPRQAIEAVYARDRERRRKAQ